MLPACLPWTEDSILWPPVDVRNDSSVLRSPADLYKFVEDVGLWPREYDTISFKKSSFPPAVYVDYNPASKHSDLWQQVQNGRITSFETWVLDPRKLMIPSEFRALWIALVLRLTPNLHLSVESCTVHAPLDITRFSLQIECASAWGESERDGFFSSRSSKGLNAARRCSARIRILSGHLSCLISVTLLRRHVSCCEKREWTICLLKTIVSCLNWCRFVSRRVACDVTKQTRFMTWNLTNAWHSLFFFSYLFW